MPHDASLEYRACLAARNGTSEALDRSDAHLAHARLATFAAAVFLAILTWRAVLSAWWLIVPAAMFAWLVRRHDRVHRARDAAIRGIEFYERGLARLEDRWRGRGEPGERFRDDRQVYANDLESDNGRNRREHERFDEELRDDPSPGNRRARPQPGRSAASHRSSTAAHHGGVVTPSLR